jgi:predicted ATPase
MTILPCQVPDLYSFQKSDKNWLHIHVSAVVGENGSGKSSLAELFYMTCYNIAAVNKVLYDEDKKRYLSGKDAVARLKVECFYQLSKDDIRMLQVNGKSIQCFEYQFSTGLFEIVNEAELDLRDFFYTVAINYSIHGLNSLFIGKWVRSIFHKNDGYQTPVVLNPYRHEGNIEINNEEYLVTSRLIANILGKLKKGQKSEDSLRNVINGKIAYKLHVSVNREKFKDRRGGQQGSFSYTKQMGSLILPLVYQHLMDKPGLEPAQTILNAYANEYILRKLVSISIKYSPYKERYQDFHKDKALAEEYLRLLKTENSHVTFKLLQALNFLTNPLYFKREEKFELTIAYLSRELSKQTKSTTKELIDILPPAFFKVDIEFKDSGLFSELSSGEKQRVFSIATLIYHCANLDSTNAQSVKYKYRRINVIFDELELYFHPDLQRTLLSDILINLKRTNLSQIEAMNLLFITHSPFILSDIPGESILVLQKNGLPQDGGLQTETFGANIFDLLKHNFFLSDGPMGALAQERITNTIEWLRNNKRDKNAEEQHRRLIQIVGEPVLQRKLAEMYDEVTGDRSEAALIEKRMAALADDLKRIKNKKK